MISVPRGKDDLSLYRGIPSPLTLAPWGFGQLLPAVSFSSCEFCNEQRNVLSVSLHPFIFRKRHWSTRYTQFAMILAGVLLGQITYPYAPFGANTAYRVDVTDFSYIHLFSPVGRRQMPATFLLLIFHRLAVLVAELACTFRRLAGDVLHGNTLPQIGPPPHTRRCDRYARFAALCLLRSVPCMAAFFS